MSGRLDVFWDEKKVGALWLGADREFLFQYDDGWLADSAQPPISLSLPLRNFPHAGGAVRAFFSNQLPESRVRELIARRLGVSVGNDFALLAALGGDCAGALTLLPAGQVPGAARGAAPLSEAELDERIRRMPERPLLSPAEGVRLSLAGAQDKLPVLLDGAQLTLPRGASPSSHILKPPIPHVEQSVQNEVFCMTLADRLGLPVPLVRMWPGRTPLALITRTDRARDAAGVLRRLHQEDLCQALGVGSDHKYEAERGPSFKDCFDVVQRVCRAPAVEKRKLLQWTLFNTLIGNADAHAKNVSLLIAADGIRLAPFYDLLSTAVYPELSQRMAMAIGGENRAAWLRKDHWDRLAEEAGVAPRAISQMAGRMLAALPEAIRATRPEVEEPAGGGGVVEKIIAHIDTAARCLQATFP